MLPRKSSSGTNQRRSSILKPPKTRQPFQDLDFNNSSTEISPESTKKRRVSFAEKKHVKEFCDHKEQGTIWDNTYEESDQNVSKSTEISSDNAENTNTDFEDVEKAMREAGYSFLQSNSDLPNSEARLKMGSNNVENSRDETICAETGNDDLELTDIIPCSQGSSIFCQDADSRGTKSMDRIEPSVSRNNVILSQARETRASSCIEKDVKIVEKSMMFDKSDGEMTFTQVISTNRNQTPTPVIVNNIQELENSSIENQTIIFEDSIMELTLTETPSKSVKNIGNNGNLVQMSDNKTVFFDDFGCDMTEAINTVVHEAADIDSEKEKRGALNSDSNGNKTIFFDDFHCEITEAINMPKNHAAHDEDIGVTRETEQIVPTQAESVPSDDVAPKLIIDDNTQKEFLDDSAMDFTVAITRKKDVRQSTLSNVLHRTEQISSKLMADDGDEVKSLDDSAMDFTVAITRKTMVQNEVQQSTLDDIPRQTEEISSKLMSEDGDKVESLDDSAMDFTVAITRKPTFQNEVQQSTLNDALQQPEEISSKLISEGGDKVESLVDSAMDFSVAITRKSKVQNEVQQSTLNDALQQPEEISSKLISEGGDKVESLDDSAMDFTVAITRKPAFQNEVQQGTLDDALQQPEEISSKLISEGGDKVESLDDSAMDFTVAITRKPKVQNKVQQNTLSEVLHRTEDISPILISEGEDKMKSHDDSAMKFTTEIASKQNVETEIEEERRPLSKVQTVIFDDCDIDITESVIVAPSTNPVSNSEKQENFLPTEHKGDDPQNNKKRKSEEITTDTVHKLFSDSMLRRNPEFDVVQSLVQDESIQVTNDNLSNAFVPNCKRLKIGECDDQRDALSSEVDLVQSEESKHVSNKERVDRVALPETQEIRNTESVNNCVEVSVSNCSKNDDNCVIDDNRELEGEETAKAADDDIEDEEYSFAKSALLNSDDDSKAEILEYSRVYEKQQQSMIEKNNDVKSRLEPDKPSLEHNDECCFVMFREELEKQAESNNCIWKIRSVDTEKVLIDFISKSLVVVIHLEVTEEVETLKIIKDIKIISLLPDSADAGILMVHKMLLKQLDPENLKRQHRTTQDVLPLLELISNKVKLLMDFMYEFDKLQDLHLMFRTENLISFKLHSYKVTLAIKITINIEPLEKIGPNDVIVECILGNVREKDIKELIIGVKKDYRFLTNYIKDIKEYIALVVEK